MRIAITVIWITQPAWRHVSAFERPPDFRQRRPRHVVARRIIWPDGIFADDRYVYCVVGQWNPLPSFQ